MIRSSAFGRLSRREWLRLTTAGVVGYSMSGWLETLAQDAARHPQRRRACILLWMSGGPSQMDTFDLKPGHANGGPFQETQTSVPGLRIGEHLPQVAQHAQHLALVRGMSTREGDHDRATFFLRTGYVPQGTIQYPSLGALVSKELGDERSELPNFVSIAPNRGISQAAHGSGFLGAPYAPLIVGENAGQGDYERALKVQDLVPPAEVTAEQARARVDLLEGLGREFLARRPGVSAQSHQMAYDRAVRLMRSAASRAFNLEEEPAALRDRYGRNHFGQGCLLARRLVERGVPFVEVTLGGLPQVPVGWDTHQQNFDNVKRLCEVLDPAWGTLMYDLKQRGLLDSTLIVWMGEFGRTPKINGDRGRDHFPNAWTTVLAGGGVKGGQAYGRTSPDGTQVAEGRVAVPDFLATVCQALGIDPTRQNLSNIGRPIRIVDKSGNPIPELLA
jgi:Protein of unknown function (DUF1501)